MKILAAALGEDVGCLGEDIGFLGFMRATASVGILAAIGPPSVRILTYLPCPRQTPSVREDIGRSRRGHWPLLVRILAALGEDIGRPR